MTEQRSYRFRHAILRRPSPSVIDGLRAVDCGDPDFAEFERQHADYAAALTEAGLTVTLLDPLDEFPDSVFVEDPALCIDAAAIVLRPGAPSRFGEAAEIAPALADHYETVHTLGQGLLDGGDVLLCDTEVLVGMSGRTDQAGFDSLAALLGDYGYLARQVEVPPSVLHFKSDCGLLDSETVLSTSRLAASGCFEDFRVLACPAGEEQAANLIRVNDVVIMRSGFPRTAELLSTAGYELRLVDSSEAARVDGGLSCMSLRCP